MTEITFRIEGEPVAWARSGRNGRRSFTPKLQKAYAEAVRVIALGSRPPGFTPFDCPVELRVLVRFERPKNRCRKIDNPDEIGWCDTGKDWDNLGKLIADALQPPKGGPRYSLAKSEAALFVNDSRVAYAIVEKQLGRAGEEPFTDVMVCPIPRKPSCCVLSMPGFLCHEHGTCLCKTIGRDCKRGRRLVRAPDG